MLLEVSVKASAPGSLMLLGEYAVLYGKPALVCAVDKWMTVTLTPRQDTGIEIHSGTLGSYKTDLAQLTIEKPFQFVLGALQHYKPKLKYGCDIHIESAFSHTVGLGSSAAVTVATLAALSTSLGIRVSPLELIRQGCRVVRAVQGIGSGADIAASVHGGIVGYQAQPLAAEKFSVLHPITAWYAGFKTPTVEAIKQVQEKFSHYPHLFRHLCNSMGQCAIEGMHLVRKQDWVRLGEVMNMQQGMMDSLGVNTPLLHEMVDTLRNDPGMLGAKISGSGLGDCVIGLGAMTEKNATHELRNVPVEMTLQGVYCEKI